VKHFHEDLRQRHGYTLGYTVTVTAVGGSGEAGAEARQAPQEASTPPVAWNDAASGWLDTSLAHLPRRSRRCKREPSGKWRGLIRDRSHWLEIEDVLRSLMPASANRFCSFLASAFAPSSLLARAAGWAPPVARWHNQ
jgi:hypothetical protein